MKFFALSVLAVSLLAIGVDSQRCRGFLCGLFGRGRGNSGGGNFNNGGNFNSGPPAPPRRPSGPGGCPPPSPNQIQNGPHGRYFPTWINGCRSFSGQGAQSYCRSIGMNAVALDNPSKRDFYKGVVANAREDYFWTGGSVGGGGVRWPNGSGQSIAQVGGWSNTGGAGRRQPDNREGNEFCLAVLNNFYQDGVQLHDVSCHHTKPTICEG